VGLGASAIKLGFQGLATKMVEDFSREAQRTYG
jgi:ribosome-associated toxin RatA of RatAB toxin-antitoxin module